MVSILFEGMHSMVKPKHQVNHLTDGNLYFFTLSIEDNNGVLCQVERRFNELGLWSISLPYSATW